MNQMLPKVLTDGDIRRRSEIFSILDEIGEDLDLTETQFERARQSYGAVGDWLSASSDPLLASVLVYLQGSTALGTAVKPVGRREFDVDLICFCAGVVGDFPCRPQGRCRESSEGTRDLRAPLGREEALLASQLRG